jgi:hypothetical protein
MLWRRLKSLFTPAIVRSESLMPVGHALSRRGFLTGSSAAVSVLAAPVIVKAESLMLIRPVAIKTVFLDTVLFGLGIDADRLGMDADRYLLDRLKDEAAQQGFEIRRPRFMDYVTGDFNLEPPIIRSDRRNALFGWQQQHRRCTVDLVDAPWLRRVS